MPKASALQDPRDEAVYLLREAAHYLALPTSTVRLWTVGQDRAVPLIQPALREPLTLSFWNLVELYVLASMRRAHTISMQRVRRALDFVEQKLGTKRPFIDEDFSTDGVDLFVERYSQHINVSRAGQTEIRQVLEGSLQRIERDTKGLATRVFPWRHSTSEPLDVVLDPKRCFGKPVIAGTAVETGVLADRFFAGDTIEALASDYGLATDKVQAAIRWEGSAALPHD